MTDLKSYKVFIYSMTIKILVAIFIKYLRVPLPHAMIFQKNDQSKCVFAVSTFQILEEISWNFMLDHTAQKLFLPKFDLLLKYDRKTTAVA